MKHFSDSDDNGYDDGHWFSHWLEDEPEDDKPIGVHFDKDPDDWYEGTIKHFQD